MTMELITYRKTLDVHKNGSQFLLQGFQTADNISRRIEISLMASGDAIDFPLERIVAMMYVTTPNAKEPSINECTIKDNKVVYNVLPIVEEGITTMQLKLIETSLDGAKSVLASPKFSVEVSKSDTDDGSAEQTTTFSALENAIAKAKATYDKGCIGITLDSECIFRAHYNDGTYYETDILQKLFLNGNVELSKSYAMGNTGVRVGEDTDNSKYYSNVAKSESLNAKAIMENSEKVLEEIRLNGTYTAFSVNFEDGTVEYVSPKHRFSINKETGELNAETQSYTFEDEIFRVVDEWIEEKGKSLDTIMFDLDQTMQMSNNNSVAIGNAEMNIMALQDETRPINLGGTGATTTKDVRQKLGIPEFYTNTYEGDGTAERIINLGFTPDVVFVFAKSGYFNSGSYAGKLSSAFACTGFNTPALEIVEGGFKVKQQSDTDNLNKDYLLNSSGSEYGYLVLTTGGKIHPYWFGE